MNFFEEQARARGQSRNLVLWFALSVLLMVAVIDAVVLFALGGFSAELAPQDRPDPLAVVLLTSIAIVAIVGLASLFRIASLSSGGAAVAQSLGAVLVPPDSTDPRLRRLRNVVEEMAIASGTPVPQIYLLEGEAGINAFASGYTPADAAVTVTRGALDKLARDELQGVIAHEFSHVLNGDMRLNIRLMGLLFGLLVLGVIGRKLLQYGPRGRGSGKNGGGIFVIALAVMVVGYVGMFCGRMIKAGVSRSREFMADASAVQFTRQTEGLARALKKAAGVREGTRLTAASGEEVAHMLFGDGVGYSWLFATHPALAARIAKLDPAFRPEQLKALAATWNAPGYQPEDEAMPGVAGLMETGTTQVRPADVAAHVGRPGEDDYQAAHALLDALPANWLAAAHDVARACEVAFALLLHQNAGIRLRQIELIERDWGRARREATCELEASRTALHRGQYLPLLSLTLPSLRRRPAAELGKLIGTMDALIRADGRVEVFEYALGRLLRDELAEVLAPRSGAVVGNLKLDEVEDPIVTLLSVLAAQGHSDAAQARRAFMAGLQRVLPKSSMPFDPPENWVPVLDTALRLLDRLRPAGKAMLVEAMVAVLSADERITIAEAELLRAICSALHLPLPPVLAQRT